MPLYNMVSDGFSIFKLYRPATIQEFKQYLFLDDNPKAKVVGFTPDYKGINPAYYNSTKNYFSEFFTKYNKLIKNYTIHYNNIKKALNNTKISYDGGYDSSSLHLRTMFSQNPTNRSESEILHILKLSKFKWFISPKIEFKDKEEMVWTLHYNPKSKPGHYTSKLFKNTQRKQSIMLSMRTAMDLYDLIRNRPFKNYYLWEVLGREKEIKLQQDNVLRQVSARVVLSTEEPATILLCHFAQKISKVIDLCDNKKFHIKDKFDFRKYEVLYYKRFQYDYFIDADWSNFDANIDTVFLKISLSILLSSISSIDKEHMRISFYIMSSVITKYVLVPPGIVVELNKAVPSGHPFTTLTNCYVNMIYWSLIGYEIYGDNYVDYMDVEVYGDDALVFFKSNKKLFEIDEIVEKIGIKSEKLCDRIYPCKLFSEMSEEPDFLKRQFNAVEVKWNPSKMWDKIINPSKERSLNDQILQILAYQETAPFDNDFNTIINEYLKHVKNEYKDQLDPNTINRIKNNEIIYENILQNYSHDKIKNKYNEGYFYEMEISRYSFCSSKRDLLSIMKEQRIKKHDAEVLLCLGIPLQFLNNFYKNEVINLLNSKGFEVVHNYNDFLKDPRDLAFKYFNEVFRPP